jgi:tetratricopeptide (TPR) repeat protein
VALVETLVAAGDFGQAQHELQRARPMAAGFFRRRLRKRLQRAAAAIAAGGLSPDGSGIRDLQQHLTNTSGPAQQRALRLRLANSYLDAGQFDAAVRESLLLVRAADEAGDAVTRAGARQVLGLALEGQGRPEEALPILSDAFRDLKTHGDTAGMLGMAEALAQRLLSAGDTLGAATVLRTAQRAAAATGNIPAELSAATMLGIALDASGDGREAVAVLAETADRAGATGHLSSRADALHSAAVALGRSRGTDDLVEALSLLDEAKRLYADHGFTDRVAGCDHEAAALLGRHGSYEAARARYQVALQAYEALPVEERDTGSWPDEVADCRANLAWLDGERSGEPTGLFRSGGHGMTHTRA